MKAVVFIGCGFVGALSLEVCYPSHGIRVVTGSDIVGFVRAPRLVAKSETLLATSDYSVS